MTNRPPRRANAGEKGFTMARLMKIKEFLADNLTGPQNNKHVWLEIREGWYERNGNHQLEVAFGGKPYPALIASWRNIVCKLGYEGVVSELKVYGGYEAWFNVPNYNRNGYNVKWRVWTKQPTEAQRKNTPWDVNTLD